VRLLVVRPLALVVPITIGLAAIALAAAPNAGNWGVGATVGQAMNVNSPNTGHLFVITHNANNQTVVEDAIFIHPCRKSNAKYHQVDAFNFKTGYIAVVNGGSFSSHGTGYLQNAGRVGGPGSKMVTVSISGTFTSGTRGHGSYEVQAAGCAKHKFVTVFLH
jgi:hypothetical protein